LNGQVKVSTAAWVVAASMVAAQACGRMPLPIDDPPDSAADRTVGTGGRPIGTGGASSGRGGTGGNGAAGTGGTGGRSAGTGGSQVIGTGGTRPIGTGGAPLGTGGRPAAGGTGGPVGMGGGGGSVSASCVSAGVLADSTARLVNLFVNDRGVLVVDAQGVTSYQRSGAVLARYASPREITAAAMDGGQLVVADRAAVVPLSADLVPEKEILVAETCASAVMVSGGRFVCGPSNDWDRIFQTYSVAAGVQIAASQAYTYKGIPMRRVPGTDDFVTVTTDSSPSDFHLYRVTESGKVVFINESPYHGDFPATMTFAFDGAPPAHLVQVTGLMLKIYGENCTDQATSFSSQCFVKDGVIGTLEGSETFVALADDGRGTLFGMVSSAGLSTFDGRCRGGCAVQRIDVASRRVISERFRAIPDLSTVVAAVPDPQCGVLYAGYTKAATGDPFRGSGFRIEALPY
jgi:hypothetical protein